MASEAELSFVPVLEKEIQSQILAYLTSLPNGMFWRNNNVPVFDWKTKQYRRPSKYTMPGIPDVLGVYRGVATAFEIKTPQRRNSKDESSQSQRVFITRFNSLGGFAKVLCSLEESVQAIGELDGRIDKGQLRLDWSE